MRCVALLALLATTVGATVSTKATWIEDTRDEKEKGGKELCTEFGIEGYPTLKYNTEPRKVSVFDFKTYDGVRDYKHMREFADKNLDTEVCDPGHLHKCSAEVKAVFEKFLAMSDLDKAITDLETERATRYKKYGADMTKIYDEAPEGSDPAVLAKDVEAEYKKDLERIGKDLPVMKEVQAHIREKSGKKQEL